MIIAKRPRRYAHASYLEGRDSSHVNVHLFLVHECIKLLKGFSCFANHSVYHCTNIPQVCNSKVETKTPYVQCLMASSWLIDCSQLSRVSSGNHCGSDPVRVQSTINNLAWPLEHIIVFDINSVQHATNIIFDWICISAISKIQPHGCCYIPSLMQ